MEAFEMDIEQKKYKEEQDAKLMSMTRDWKNFLQSMLELIENNYPCFACEKRDKRYEKDEFGWCNNCCSACMSWVYLKKDTQMKVREFEEHCVKEINLYDRFMNRMV